MNSIKLMALLLCSIAFSQQPYYNDVDLSLTGQDLYFELQNKIDQASSTYNYGDVRDTFLISDEDPDNANNVLLIYGHTNNGDCTTDRTRDKDDFGGTNCLYNREHVFSRSNANPTMGNVSNSTTGIGADPHNLRPSDQQMNNNRGSKKFAAGNGNAGDVGSGNWFPGDEWKGDVARMMMYMYTRYGDRCLPSLNGVGATQGTTDMLQIYLQWNVDDPVSVYEDQRNPVTEAEYGNRNPFIDNPVLATIIWGGPEAEDRWNLLGNEEFDDVDFKIFPNPASQTIWVQSSATINSVYVYDLSGRLIQEYVVNTTSAKININGLSKGLYLIEANSNRTKTSKKMLVE